MKKLMKKSICILMCISILFAFSGCSGSELTQENTEKTVETALTALKEFDEKKLEKYVESETLSYILKLANGHDQFSQLGQAIFENLTMEIENIDLEAKTVTVSVKNKDLYGIASEFAYNLLKDYSTFQLLQKLSDDSFLDSSLGELTQGITDASMNDEAKSITLSIKQEKQNLVLVFDETAEDAVSGGALKAIKNLI